MVLQMGANGASCQELQIAPKNRFPRSIRDNYVPFGPVLRITGIRSQVPAIFIKNNGTVLGDSNKMFLAWCCKWAQMVHLVESYK